MEHPTELIKRLSLPLLVFYGIGTILGAGIYVLVGKVAGEAGMFAPFAFMLAALLAAFSAFSYAELAARFPRSAGEAIYVEEAFAIKNLSLIVGLMVVSVGIVSVATLVHGFVGYLSSYSDLSSSAIIILLVLSTGLICVWGVGQSVTIAAMMTVIEIIGLLVIIYVGRDSFLLIPEKMSTLLPDFNVSVWAGIISGSFIAFYAYLGFEDIVNVAEEAVNAEKNIPRAIIIALLVTTVFYILVSVVSILSVTPETLAASKAPLAMIYENKTGQGAVLISMISLISIVNGALIQVIMASRVIYGMSRKKWLPEKLGYVSAITHTPVYATWLVAGLILIFSLLLPIVSLAKMTSFITLIIFMMINFALVKIKYSAAPHDGFSVPNWLPWLGGICSLLFLLQQTFSMMF